MKKRIAILGATGSIGTQALDVIASSSEALEVEVMTAQSQVDKLADLALIHNPNVVVIADDKLLPRLKDRLAHTTIKAYGGAASLEQVVQMDTVDMVLTAMVGYSGLLPTIRAIEAGKTIALANKETLVVAGDLITRLAKEKGVNIYPVDSEHSAIFQCLVGEFHNPVEKIVLTASGGPFRGRKAADLAEVTRHQALKHPNWVMGAKITIDSATLMNKGLEVIEAKWLFGLNPNEIEVVVHPQSIIHSLVQFRDGSLKAQLGLPDMKLPIQYALGYPRRLNNEFPRFSFTQFPYLTFEAPDMETFRNLALAFDALNSGGTAPCVLNAANEVAVAAFLEDRISFLGMSDLVAKALHTHTIIPQPSLDDYRAADAETRLRCENWLETQTF